VIIVPAMNTKTLLIGTLLLVSACGSDAPVDPADVATDTVASDASSPPTDTETGAQTDATAATSDASSEDPDTTESACPYTGSYLIAGPCEADHDAALAAKARRYERTWVTFHTALHGASVDLGISVDNAEDRGLIQSFIDAHDGWDFEAFAGKAPLDIFPGGGKVAGLYAGVGIAASAYRYGVLRDQGYPLEEVDLAREHLLMGLEVFHQAATVPGVPGVIARSLDRVGGHATTPLFDEDGNPLPEIKNNGTWRADESGLYPDIIWEDSCSRDYLMGWVTAAGAAWEVMHDDPTFEGAQKTQLQGHAKDLGHALMMVRDDPAFCQGLDNCHLGLGYDLQIPDADGRRTLHGCLHEHDLDCNGVLEFIDNGFNAVMALGFVATWAYVSEDPELITYLNDALITERDLHTMSRDSLDLLALGQGANWSGWNMAFGGMWAAQRYVTPEVARDALQVAVATGLYDIEGATFLPVEAAQSYFDFIYAAGAAGLGAHQVANQGVDQAAMDRGMGTLHGFSEPPYYDVAMVNCPDSVCACQSEDCSGSDKEVAVHECVAPDGTEFNVLGCYGWKGTLIADTPVPMHIRPASNYHWRSNPYTPNSGGVHGEVGGQMLPAVDFRIAYWLGRWAKVSD
jgi:hypothetical protein